MPIRLACVLMGIALLLYPLTSDARFMPAGIITLTFDDASEGQYVYALPSATQYGIVGTLFIKTGCISSDPWCMTWEQLRMFSGWEIGAHTISHPDLTTLDNAAIEQEAVGSADVLEKMLGKRPTSFAEPFGNYDEHVLSIVSRYFSENAFAWGDPNSLSGVDHERINRTGIDSSMSAEQVCALIGNAYSSHWWLVLMFHQIVLSDHPGEYQISAEEFDQIMKCAAQLRDQGKIKIMTLHDAAQMVPRL